jgi:hypothetical protein
VTARRVAAVGVLVIVAFFAVLLTQRGERTSGTNLTPDRELVALLGGGQQVCQEQELLPGDTAALRLGIDVSGAGPPLSATVTGRDGATLTSGRLAAGWRGGEVRIPVSHVSRTAADARVCVRDDDPARGGRAIDLGGQAYSLGQTAEVAGKLEENVHIRIDYLRPGRESWLRLAPTIVSRFSLGKADPLRHWAWVAFLVLMLGCAVLAVRTILSASPPDGESAPRAR